MHARRQAQHRARVRHARARARRAARHRALLVARRERQAAERQARIAEEEAEIGSEEEAASCDPNYSGACLDPNASDYDCEGGSGNGPYYTGTVTVVGADPYGLDADGDGIGCEAE